MSSASAFALLHNRIRNAAEYQGLEADQILKQLHDEAEAKMINERDRVKGQVERGSEHSESRMSDAVMLVARAMAYRGASLDDLAGITRLLQLAYKAELEGPESFRVGEVAVLESEVEALLKEDSYQWIVVEAPAGQTSEPEGTILGVCCFSTDGKFKTSGDSPPKKMGSVRFFAILPKYHGYCMGRRMLAKMHHSMIRQGCELSLVNLPSSRMTLIDWIQRCQYEPIRELPYPFASLGHSEAPRTEGSEANTLVQFVHVLSPSPTPSTSAPESSSQTKTDSSKQLPSKEGRSAEAPPRRRFVQSDLAIHGESPQEQEVKSAESEMQEILSEVD